MSDGKVDVAVLKTLLGGVKEKLQEMYKGQADFLKEWPTYVSKLAALEERVTGLEKKLTDYIEAQRYSWTTIISVVSLVVSSAILLWDYFKSH